MFHLIASLDNKHFALNNQNCTKCSELHLTPSPLWMVSGRGDMCSLVSVNISVGSVSVMWGTSTSQHNNMVLLSAISWYQHEFKSFSDSHLLPQWTVVSVNGEMGQHQRQKNFMGTVSHIIYELSNNKLIIEI